jgi:hypothetical protein
MSAREQWQLAWRLARVVACDREQFAPYPFDVPGLDTALPYYTDAVRLLGHRHDDDPLEWQSWSRGWRLTSADPSV